MNTALPNPHRVFKLKKRFIDVLSGSVKLDPPSRGATLFLEGLCVQDDPLACLDVITKSAHGLILVQSAMQFDLSVHFMNGLGTTVLEYLLRASDVGGDGLDNLLFHIVQPPIFWDAFLRAFQQGSLSENAQLAFARLLSRLLTLRNRDITPYRDITVQLCIQDTLIASSRHEMREIGHLIQHILSSNTSMSISSILNGPGGRHDNDFPNFRNIAILPTPDEILCQRSPFLCPIFHDELDTSEASVTTYLDNTFRMLRDDMLFGIREEVQDILPGKGKSHGFRVTSTVSFVGVYTGADDRKKTPWGIKLRCKKDFKGLKKMSNEDDRISFLRSDPHGSRVLKHQSLVCLFSGRDIIGFGTVNRVEELLACKPPVIVLQPDGDVNTKNILSSIRRTKNVQLTQLNAATFSFSPVLTALQRMTSVPLAEEILYWKPKSSITGSRKRPGLLQIANAIIEDPSIDLRRLYNIPKSIHLDKSQAMSMVAGLTNRVSLIQGPPGTGKSFIGTILAKAIHDKTSQTILVICYTNHALDQFLGDLIGYGIPTKSIVRLGGRSNQSIEHLSLHNQQRPKVLYDWGRIEGLELDALDQEHKLKAYFDTLLDKNFDMELITHLDREFFDAFYVPSQTDDGMMLVGENGRAIDNTYLFSRWAQGLDAGVLSGEPHVRASARIWAMDHSARQQLVAKWRNELISRSMDGICQSGRQWNELGDAIRHELGASTVALLRNKRIIACTTTGAAIYAKVIQEVSPEVLLVEEAGEILESHIVTALSKSVDNMILIGDHKQLRPKVNNYQLTVEKGEGFDLNRSLFERLVLKGYPHETLSTQHRMRPEISAFVRELTYPDLVDAPSTRLRPNIRGVQSNVIFVDHGHPEDDDALITDRADGGTKTSKQNTYEVQMVIKMVRYLVQQGYNSEDIVILTPYLGQLHHLRDAMKRDNDPILNDMDSLDLSRAGLSPKSPSPSGQKSKKEGIRLATIDNYQGEESKIVIASLTRSNESNMIGFMDSPERLNVLLSRARDGLIMIGNSRTFLNSKKGGALWQRLFALLEKGGYLYQGFPIKCERHPERTALLKQAGDFDDYYSDDWCTELCGYTLTCGHTCEMKCHSSQSSALPDPHDASQCKRDMEEMCSAGNHRINWVCCVGRPSGCEACVEETIRRMEEISRKMSEEQRLQEEAENEHRRRMDELREENTVLERKLGENSKKAVVPSQGEEKLVKQGHEHRKQGHGDEKTDVEKRKNEIQEAIHKKEEEKNKRKEERKRQQERERTLQATTRPAQKAPSSELQAGKAAFECKPAEPSKPKGVQKTKGKKGKKDAKQQTKELSKEEQESMMWDLMAEVESYKWALGWTSRGPACPQQVKQEKPRKEVPSMRQEKKLRKKEEEQKMKEEQAARREAADKRREEVLKMEIRAQEEHAKLAQEAAHKKQQETERKLREEQTAQLQEATNKRQKEVLQMEIRTREEHARLIQEATHKRQREMEDKLREEQHRKRQEHTKKLVDAARQRQEEERSRRQEELVLKKREEQAKRLQEATQRREEDRKQENIGIRQEQAARLQEATQRREEDMRQERSGIRQEQAARLREATRQRVGQYWEEVWHASEYQT